MKRKDKPGLKSTHPRDPENGQLVKDVKHIQALRKALKEYIDSKAVPILAEFAYQNGYDVRGLCVIPELDDLRALCRTKKEAALEQGGLFNKINVSMAIFSLKQLGWSDNPKMEELARKKQVIKIGGKEIEF